MTYESHTSNVMAVGFQSDGNWMYSGSEDGTVKIWDIRSSPQSFLFLPFSFFLFFVFIILFQGPRMSARI